MKNLIWISLVLLLASCVGTEKLQPEAYLSWVKSSDNPLIAGKTLNDYSFDVQVLPPEAVALQAYGTKATSQADWPEILDSYDTPGRHYILFRITNEQSNQPILKRISPDAGSYQLNTRYMAFGMQKDLKLLAGNDTVDCRFFHFERTYDITPFSSYMLTFDLPEGVQSKPLSFLYNDPLLGVGPVHIGLPKATDLPILSFEPSPSK